MGKKRIPQKAILQLKEGNVVREWASAYRASKELNADRSNIVACLQGRLKTSNGFSWAYAKGCTGEQCNE